MMEIDAQEQILLMLKALADESRLSLLRLLAKNEHTVTDLAVEVNLGEPTVSHHLTKLREAGFVTLRMAGNQRFYRVNETGLDRFKQLATLVEQFPDRSEQAAADDSWIAMLGWDSEDQQVLREYTSDKKLTHLPTKQKKLLVILRWLSTLFETGKLYSEAEVNGVLKSVYEEDYVSLRRDLVDLGYLRRERGGGKYWLAPAEPETPAGG